MADPALVWKVAAASFRQQNSDLQAANNALLERAREAERKLRQRRINVPTLVICLFFMGVIVGGAWQAYGDWKAVEGVKVSSAIDRQTASWWKDITFAMTDGMVKQAKRAQACEDGFTMQFDMRGK